MARELDLQRLAARQHGLASRQQLIQLGFTRHDIEGRSRRDLWPRVAPQVYDIAPASFDPLRPLQAAVLATRGVGSHRSAATLSGMLDIAVELPEVLVQEGRLPRGVAAVMRRTHTLTRQECTTIKGIACTNPVRTLLDLGAAVDSATFEIALNRAVTLGLTSVRRMLHVIDTVPLAGRPGAAVLREVLEHYRRDSTVTASLLETIVERAVRAGRIPPPTRQYAARVGSARYRLDFAWPEARVLLEADGLADHHGRTAFENDRVRQNRLVIAGWYPLRYTWAVAKHRPAHIADELASLLAARQRIAR